MDQKMKNFDRRIEQMMNENEVAPPFGMWNRISAELETEATPVPVSVNSPIPQRMVVGFIAGALLIGTSMVTAYVVNNFSTKESKPLAVNTIIAKPIVNQSPATYTNPVALIKPELKASLRSTKPTTVAKPVEETTTVQVENSSPVQALTMNTEVSVPSQTVAQNNAVNEPYFFPAIDMITTEGKLQEKESLPTTKTVKAEPKTITEDNDRDLVSNDPPRIKFRPKKHRSFSYGKIIRVGKR